MHLLNMEGGWGRFTGWLYERVVGGAVGDLYDRFVENLLTDIPQGSKVLEVGCGQGQISSRIALLMPDSHVIGVDLSPDMVRRAETHNEPRDNLEFRRGDALDLPFDDESFDVAVSVASIKHWPDRHRGAREMLRVLRPDGLLCIVEVDRACSRSATSRFVASWQHLAPGSAPLENIYFHRFVVGQGLNLDELVGVLTRTGVVDLDAFRLSDLPFVVAKARKAQ